MWKHRRNSNSNSLHTLLILPTAFLANLDAFPSAVMKLGCYEARVFISVTISFILYFDIDSRITAALKLPLGKELHIDPNLFQNFSKSTHSNWLLFLLFLSFVLW